jgi:hypothetical protein
MTDPERAPDHDRLHALLEDAVADVHPSPALDRIRARTKVTPMRRTRPWFLVTAGAVAATAATVVGVSLLDGRSPQADDPGPGPAATATATDPATPTDAPTEEPTPSETPSEPAGQTVALPVYYLGETPAGSRLFREFHDTSVGSGTSARLLAALKLAVEGNASDPDYGSPWPAGSQVVKAELDQASDRLVLGVDAAADLAELPAGTTEDDARLAVQQLVYTAQAVVQERAPVVLTDADGRPLETLLGVGVSPQVEAAPALEVQAPVWVITPQDGATVRRTFTVEGRGAFFEANVSWQLLRGDEVVDEDFTTAQECCTLSPYSFEVTAEPGDYVLRVYDADVSDGEGPGEQEDTKRITVR